MYFSFFFKINLATCIHAQDGECLVSDVTLLLSCKNIHYVVGKSDNLSLSLCTAIDDRLFSCNVQSSAQSSLNFK